MTASKPPKREVFCCKKKVVIKIDREKDQLDRKIKAPDAIDVYLGRDPKEALREAEKQRPRTNDEILEERHSLWRHRPRG